jgi:hypothetical protein
VETHGFTVGYFLPRLRRWGWIGFASHAHGGSTGFSDWSDTVQHMCM